MAEKITQTQLYTRIAELCADDPEIVAFCELKVEQIRVAREKAKQRRAEKAADPEVAKFRDDIVAFLTENGAKTNKELFTEFGVTSQKMAANLRQLVLEGRVVRTEDAEKKTAPALFSVPADDAE